MIMATARAAVRGVAPTTRSMTTAASPITDAAVRRFTDRVGAGARCASTPARAHAMTATRTKAIASHSGRVIHHSRLLGSGRAIPVIIAKTALTPAIVSSTGMCHR